MAFKDSNLYEHCSGVSDELEKTEGVYFDMSEDKRYVNTTANAATTARGHTRRDAQDASEDQVGSSSSAYSVYSSAYIKFFHHLFPNSICNKWRC